MRVFYDRNQIKMLKIPVKQNFHLTAKKKTQSAQSCFG